MISSDTGKSNSNEEKIQKLRNFSQLLKEYDEDPSPHLRSNINQERGSVRQIVLEAHGLQLYHIAPPPAIGGFVQRNVDLFDRLFDSIHGLNVTDRIIDMIDVAVGNIKGGVFDRVVQNTEVATPEVRAGYAFIAMSIDPSNKELEDVLDAIKATASDLGIEAERIDEQESNNRITDRIFEAIRVAQFVIVDVTGARPNVFYEAGYAQGIGKIPIFLAKEGTKPEFDIKDYPIIFYGNMRSLRERLKSRLQAVAKGSEK